MKEYKDIITKEIKHLDPKSPHTKYKIIYVKEYTKNWAYVACGSDADNINFIDCMCNAGVYADGDFCSSIEILNAFVDIAYQFPNKKFNIFLNDNNKDRIRISFDLIKRLHPKLPRNLSYFIDNEDVNDYFSLLLKKYKTFNYPSRTILYVDPYDFHTVVLDKMGYFLSRVYCELIFNLFTSDFIRNGNDEGIIKVLGGKYDLKTYEDLTAHVQKRFRKGKMKYCFAYPFRISKNVELYRILFITPHIKGLDVFKKSVVGFI